MHKTCGTILEMRASHFINDGLRCRKCSIKKITGTNADFDKSLKKYKNNNLERASEYSGYHSEITLYCKCCKKEFITKPVNLKRQFDTFGEIFCPNCKEGYMGEKFVKEILEKYKISFKRQFFFHDCKDKKPLLFDFAIVDLNGNVIALIEFDGSQHRDKKSKYAGENFETIQYHDYLKNKYCEDKHIPLLRLSSYKKKKLENQILDFLKTKNILEK